MGSVPSLPGGAFVDCSCYTKIAIYPFYSPFINQLVIMTGRANFYNEECSNSNEF